MHTFSVRQFDPANDFGAYLKLLELRDGAETTEQAQRDYADMLAIDLYTDRLLVDHPEQPDKVIAACDIWRINQNPSADLMLYVHPAWRRRGVGSLLFAAALRHARTIEATAIDAYAEPRQKAVQAFVEHHHFERVSHCIGMAMTVSGPFAKPDLPANYTVRTYAELGGSETEKLDLLVKAGNDFWGVLWGHKVTKDLRLAREVMVKHVLSAYDEAAMFFLYDGDTYVGHDRVNVSEADGDRQGYGGGVPALHPDYHTPGLAKAFALVGLNWLYNKGCKQISFTAWGERKETLQAFEALGFEETFFELGYQLALA